MYFGPVFQTALPPLTAMSASVSSHKLLTANAGLTIRLLRLALDPGKIRPSIFFIFLRLGKCDFNCTS